MKKSFRGILVLIALFLTVAFGVILANQTLQLALFAERFHPAAGDAVFWALIFMYAALLLVPLYLVLRLPRSLIPPDEDSGCSAGLLRTEPPRSGPRWPGRPGGRSRER